MPLPSTQITVVDGGLNIIPPSGAQAHVKIGPCSAGTDNTLYAAGTHKAVRSQVGYGATADAACAALSTTSRGRPVGTVYVMKSHATTPGVAGTVTPTRAGSSTGTVATTGSVPVDTYAVKVLIQRTGTLGAGQFQYSLNGGTDYSPWTLIPSGGTYVVPNVGVTLVFTAGAGPTFFQAGDVFAFSTTGPISSNTDLAAAFAALLADPRTWGFAHVVGAAADPTALAAQFDAVATQVALLEAGSRAVRVMLEAPVASDSALIAAMSVKANPRIAVGADLLDYVVPDTGWTLARSVTWACAARAACIPVGEDVAWVEAGPAAGVSIVGHRDERATPGLYDERFMVARTYDDVDTPGVFLNAPLFSAPGSDFQLLQDGRVMDEAIRYGRAALRRFESSGHAIPPGATSLDPADAAHVEAVVEGAIKAALGGQISDARFRLNDLSQVFSNRKLDCTISVYPLAYFKTITASIGFANPFANLGG